MCQFDESHDVSGVPPPATRQTSDHGGEEPPPNPGAVQKLVNASAALPQPSLECLDKAADMVKSGGQLLAAGAAVVASGPTLLGVVLTGTAFVALSAAFAASLAKYENCEDDAAAQPEPP